MFWKNSFCTVQIIGFEYISEFLFETSNLETYIKIKLNTLPKYYSLTQYLHFYDLGLTKTEIYIYPRT